MQVSRASTRDRPDFYSGWFPEIWLGKLIEELNCRSGWMEKQNLRFM